ncbi:MAG: hypothetical protein ABGZ36_20245 [Actinomycetota bacterium]|uniref:hypothetical protein n=1 Tax=Euzebya rosea TaxID=2052804 RepID=UPI000D3E8EC9|nr:hypothetical protein [Euzebya rosea]
MTAPRQAVAGVLLIMVSACGPTGTIAGPATVAATPADRIDVGLTDFAIASSSAVVVVGTVTIDVTNAGATAHDLRIGGDGIDERSEVLPPGGTTTLSMATTEADRLTLWCTLPGHRRQGMETTLSIGNRSPGGAGAS